MTPNKRKQLIITPVIQFKLIALILISLSIPAVIILFWTHTLLEQIIALTGSQSEVIQAAISISIKKILSVIILGFSAITILMLYWCVIFSNRIVGPIYRLEKTLDTVIANDFTGKVTFRKFDAFASLAQKVNLLLEEIRTLRR